MQDRSTTLEDDDFFEGPSKSQRKREATRLQELGIRLTELSAKQIATLELDETLLAAIDEHKKLPNSYSARKRHAQYIGKLMRGRDYDTLLAAVDELQNPRTTARPGTTKKPLSPTAQACTDLLASTEGCEDIITQLIETHPRLERQTLRQLTRACFAADKKQDDAASKRSRTKLSHYVSQNLH